MTTTTNSTVERIGLNEDNTFGLHALWDPYAPLIYLWTAEEASAERAWIVVYHGGVFAKPKAVGSPSFGFRAVREPEEVAGARE